MTGKEAKAAGADAEMHSTLHDFTQEKFKHDINSMVDDADAAMASLLEEEAQEAARKAADKAKKQKKKQAKKAAKVASKVCEIVCLIKCITSPPDEVHHESLCRSLSRNTLLTRTVVLESPNETRCSL